MRKVGDSWGLLKHSFIILIGLVFFSTQSNAQGNLMINPKRVVFDGNNRSQEINLINIGKDSARYAVSFVQYRMKTDGSFELISKPDSGQNFADKNLRIFPRTVTLAPNEAQVVKLQVAQTDKLQSGEYRSHLYFRALSEETPLGVSTEASQSKDVSVNLKAVFGISIPVIIRKGQSTAKASISDLHVETPPNQIPSASFTINRSGNMSVYGDLSIVHISPEGKISKVGLAKGVSVYTPITYRKMKVALDTSSGINYRSGKLRVTYSTPVQENAEQLTTAEINLK